MTMHIPTERPGCWTDTATSRHWAFGGFSVMCRAWPDEATRLKLQGNTCDGCARLKAPVPSIDLTPDAETIRDDIIYRCTRVYDDHIVHPDGRVKFIRPGERPAPWWFTV